MNDFLTSDSLKENIKFLLCQLTEAKNYCTLIISIYQVCSDDQKRQRLNKAHNFFAITLDALWSSLYMTLARIFDKNSQSIRYEAVLNACQADQKFPHEYIEECYIDCETGESSNTHPVPFDVISFTQKTFEALEKLKYLQIRKLRDKKYAHNDKGILKCDVDYVSIKEANELITLASNILNQLLVVKCGEIVCIDIIDSDDLGNLFQ